jgi:hypothetical protein
MDEELRRAREQAKTFRRLARETADDRTRSVLLDMAYESDARMKLARAARPH